MDDAGLRSFWRCASRHLADPAIPILPTARFLSLKTLIQAKVAHAENAPPVPEMLDWGHEAAVVR